MKNGTKRKHKKEKKEKINKSTSITDKAMIVLLWRIVLLQNTA